MIEILPSPPHLVAVRFEGILSGGDYDACIAEIERHLASQPRMNVYCDLANCISLSTEAMGKDLHYAATHLGTYKRFARCAIVTDRRWVEAITKFAGHFFPHTDMRTFDLAQRDDAMAWALQPIAADDDA